MSRGAAAVRAILYVLGTLAWVVGIPVFLVVAFGNPWPGGGFNWDMYVTDEMLVGAVVVVAWYCWAQLVVSLLAAVVEEAARRARAPRRVRVRLPGTLTIFDRFTAMTAEAIVGAVLSATTLTTAAGPVVAAAGPSAPVEHAAPQVTGLGQSQTTPSQTPQGAPGESDRHAPAERAEQRAASSPLRVERAGESLWALADRHLGDPLRWKEIRDLNRGRVMADGTRFTSPNQLRVGWELLMPADSAHAVAPPKDDATGDLGSSHRVKVKPADTLSKIAADELGDADRWPEVWRANRGEVQSDGTSLTDPDLIRPGWRLTVPGRTAGGAAPAPDRTPDQQSRNGAERPKPPAAEPSIPETSTPSTKPQTPQEAPAPTPGPEATAPGTNAPGPEETPGVTDPLAQEPPADADSSGSTPAWVTPGLTGAGALLAAAIALGLQRRRRDQHRSRRPGRLVSIPGPMVDSMEADVVVAGAPHITIVELVDDVLRRTAAHVITSDAQLPQLAAVQVTGAEVRLHLREAAVPPPGPWSPVTGREWALDRADVTSLPEGVTPLDQAPWPLVATVGHDNLGGAWLMNLEGTCAEVLGDTEAAADFSRFVAAEIACNPWSRWAGLDLIGVGAEVQPMRPERVRVHERAAAPVAEAIADTVRSVDHLAEQNVDLPTARAGDPDLDPWPARLLIAHRTVRPVELDHLMDLVEGHRDRTGTGTLIHALDPPANPVTDPVGAGASGNQTPERATSTVTVRIDIDRSRRMRIEGIDSELTAVRLTAAEAAGCAALLAHADTADDVAATDLGGDHAWQSMVTVTGSLRDQYRMGRGARTTEPAASLLPDADTSYATVAATTPQDLDALAPKVTTGTRREVLDADPSLDADLAEWASDHTTRPRLAVLGPVALRAAGNARADRRPYYTGLLAFLQTRPHGATSEQIAEAFNLTRERARTSASELRAWLGTDDDGEAFLPDARRTPAGRASGVPVYQPQRVLFDMDLFRRLRARGEAVGPDGIDDLATALELVAGEPFDQLGPRPIGWAWMLGAGSAERLDHMMTASIVDVAHTVVTHGLHSGDVDLAARAARTATAVAPSSHVAQLDLAAVLHARGHHDEARRLVDDDVCNYSDDGGAPAPVPARTAEVIEARHWLDRDAS